MNTDLQERILELRNKLIDVLVELDEIKPVQFRDIDCENSVFNFSDVTLDEKEGKVFVDIAMWHDSLPSHALHPLKNSRGNVIPYRPLSSINGLKKMSFK